MKLNIGNVLDLLTALHNSLKAHGVVNADGTINPADASVFAAIAQDVEKALKASGVVVPQKVDVLVSLLPGILAAFGV